MTTTPITPSQNELDERLTSLERRVREVETRLAVPVPRPVAVPARAPSPVAPPAPPVAAPAPPAPAPAPARPQRVARPIQERFPRTAAAQRPPRPSFDLERFLGGRVLAWVGGVAVLAGLVLLFALGVSSGWIGPVGRTLTGGALATLLVVAGIWLHERKGRTEAARAAVAAGAGGLFLAITVAARVYDILPSAAGLLLAAAVATGTALLAMRWSSPVIGAIGVIGALLAPALAGATLDVGTLAFLLVAALGASLVLLRERWTWLSAAVFLIPGAQLVVWLDQRPSALAAATVLTAFGIVNVVAALGVDIRSRETPLRLAGAYLLGANAILLSVGGWLAIDATAGSVAGVAWLTALALAHAGVGTLARRRRQISSELEMLALALATLIGNTAFALADVGAPVRACVWGMTAVGFAYLARRGSRTPASEALLGLGVGGQVALTLVQTVALLGGHGGQLLGPGADGGLIVALLALASSCLVSGRLARAGHPEWRYALDTLGLLATATLTLVVLDGAAVTAAWAGGAVVLGQIARRDGDPLSRGASFAHLVGAAAWCLADQAPPADLTAHLTDWMPAAIGLGAVALAATRLARLNARGSVERRVLITVAATLPAYFVALVAGGLPLTIALAITAVALTELAMREDDGILRHVALAQLAIGVCWWVGALASPLEVVDGSAGLLPAVLGAVALTLAALRLARTSPDDSAERRVLCALTALVPLYVASVATLTLGPSAGSGFAPGQQGQLALSALWAVTGVVALVMGLRRDLRDLRVAALGLLAVTIAKVFLYDLATLTSGWRIASFLALGLLLLGAGFAYQRLRPAPPLAMEEDSGPTERPLPVPVH